MRFTDSGNDIISKKQIVNSATINQCIHDAVEKVKGNVSKQNKMEEPDYTAALAVEFPQKINDHHLFGMTVGGCYIHQSPYVNFMRDTQSCRCELGDLLIVVRRHKAEMQRFNAALLQLKKTDHLPNKLRDNGDLIQLYLYKSWPAFSINKITGKFDIVPKSPHKGALYCVVKTNIDSDEQFIVSTTSQELPCSPEMTLNDFIIGLISWTCGRAISMEMDKDKDEWSRLIWEVLQHTKNKTFTRKNSGYQKARGAHRCNTEMNDFFQLMLNTPLYEGEYGSWSHQKFDNDGTAENTSSTKDAEDDGIGISTLFIDIDEEQFLMEE